MRRLFSLLLLILLLESCASEESLIKELESDPDNVEIIETLADRYYDDYKYKKAHTYYKRLEKLNPLNDEQAYRMYTSGTRISEFFKESWNKIDSFRNTDFVEYTTIKTREVFQFTVPDHWIVFDPDDKFNEPYNPKELKTISELAAMKGKYGGLIYCGPSFIISYSVAFPRQVEISGSDYRTYYRTYYYHGLREQLQSLLEEYGIKLVNNKIKDLKCYVFEKKEAVSRSGKSLGIDKRKVEYSKEVFIDDEYDNIGYITYLNIDGSKKRYFHIIYRGEKGNSRLELKTQFDEKYSDLYMEEIDIFCWGVKVIPFSFHVR